MEECRGDGNQGRGNRGRRAVHVVFALQRFRLEHHRLIGWWLGREPFAVLLGDEVMIARPGRPSGIAHLARIYEEMQQSTVAVMEVAEEDVSEYGIVRVSDQGPNLWSVHDVVEKPAVGQAPSRLALPGPLCLRWR